MHAAAVPSLLLGLVLAFASAATNQKIGVTVYYESLCPDSMDFIKNQLYPTYMTDLGAYMNLTLVPFGKAKYHREDSNGKNELVFECRHGSVECDGDKAQACVIHEVKDENAVMKFIQCAMSSASKSTPYPTDKCLKEANITSNAEDLKNCSMSDRGSDYLAEFGAMTTKLSPELTSVPTVYINDKLNASEQASLLSDFKSTFCNYIQGAKPEECSKKNSAASLVSSLLPIFTVLILTRISY
ncbi:GILT-like protein 1 isoform X2 [Bemisia tabaci]|uniref:GILT-like protein 1 isoform X2 n=1 Tax=Bemisia tabaci TaxID=7038 RepID=UPI003B28D332